MYMFVCVCVCASVRAAGQAGGPAHLYVSTWFCRVQFWAHCHRDEAARVIRVQVVLVVTG